jgi:hypothetical protein
MYRSHSMYDDQPTVWGGSKWFKLSFITPRTPLMSYHYSFLSPLLWTYMIPKTIMTLLLTSKCTANVSWFAIFFVCWVPVSFKIWHGISSRGLIAFLTWSVHFSREQKKNEGPKKMSALVETSSPRTSRAPVIDTCKYRGENGVASDDWLRARLVTSDPYHYSSRWATL